MVRKPEGHDPEFWLSDVAEFLLPEFHGDADDSDHQEEIRRVASTIQEYKYRGIVEPRESAVGKGGRNVYGRTELIVLAAAKALAESGMFLADIATFFSYLKSSPSQLNKPSFNASLRGIYAMSRASEPMNLGDSAYLLHFDPLPEDPVVLEALTDVTAGMQVPQVVDGWPEYWEGISQLIRATPDTPRGALEVVLFPVRQLTSDGKGRAATSKTTRAQEAFALRRLLWNPIRRHEMVDVTTARVIDLARIKARISHQLLAREAR